MIQRHCEKALLSRRDLRTMVTSVAIVAIVSVGAQHAAPAEDAWLS
jgi:hypothetical protein